MDLNSFTNSLNNIGQLDPDIMAGIQETNDRRRNSENANIEAAKHTREINENVKNIGDRVDVITGEVRKIEKDLNNERRDRELADVGTRRTTRNWNILAAVLSGAALLVSILTAIFK